MEKYLFHDLYCGKNGTGKSSIVDFYEILFSVTGIDKYS